MLAATEKRHARILRELDEEKQRSAADAAQGDDLCVLLENERTRLRQQVHFRSPILSTFIRMRTIFFTNFFNYCFFFFIE